VKRSPLWARLLLRSVAPRGDVDTILGDLEERQFTAFETLHFAAALVRERFYGFIKGSSTLQDYKLGLRMLVKYPGLTIAGGLALAIAIAVGAGWYDFMGDFWRPRLPFPDGERIVEVEMRNAAAGEDERRIAHDFAGWRRDARSLQLLGAYRTLERNLILGDAAPEPVTVAETTASMFQLTGVPPLLGRHLLEADEQPGVTPVVVLGYHLWKHRFDGRTDVIGQSIQLGRAKTLVVGVMPEDYTFPVNHRMWLPLHLESAGYAPLDGPAIRVFGRVAPGFTQAQANAELKTMTERVASASPATHQHLRPRVLAWGGQSPGDRSILEIAITYLPVFLVLLVACANVGTLIYARTATRDAEISMRYALGATRDRIIAQLFVEALVLSSIAALVGLTAAHYALRWGLTAYYAGEGASLPFWLNPGLKMTTVVFAAVLTVLASAILGVMPAFKATGKDLQAQLKRVGTGGSTLRFGAIWTTAMIAQVALTVICIPPAIGISEESWRDRVIRSRFPAEQYLAVRLDVDREKSAAGGEEPVQTFADRFSRTYAELERRIAQEPAVAGITYGDRLPGMGIAISSAEVEAAPGAPLAAVETAWTAAVGPKYFDTFDVPLVTGRDFDDRDRTPSARAVLVNENFARLHLGGVNPVGKRLRFTAGAAAANAAGRAAEPWFEIVGMVRDIGMQPTDRGEAPFIFLPATLATARPVVMGIRTSGDPATLAQRVRTIAADVDPALRLGDVRSLEDLAWQQDVPQAVAASTIVGIVTLGLFLSAAGIFALMSVNVARRTKEIGLRAALGATPARILGGIFRRAFVLIGSGVAAGNAVLLLFVYLSDGVTLGTMASGLMMTSAVMLTVGLLACVEPALRALRIQPTDALKEA
jgi:putative ABC transport system permease protein